MEQVLTLVCKLNPIPQQLAQIEVTLKAKMISLLGQSVSLPGGSGYLCCNLSTDSSGLLQSPAL